MPVLWKSPAIALVAILAGLALATAPARADDALLWLPEGLNAVLVIDANAAYRSPLALEEKWAQKTAQAFVAQDLFLPPSTRRITVGAELDLTGSLNPIRRQLIMEVKAGTELADIASVTGGSVEKVDDWQGLSVLDGRYLVEAKQAEYLMVEPGGRQAALRWVRAGASPAPRVSKFLQQAVGSVSDQFPIVTALDLTDAVDVASAKAVLSSLPNRPFTGAELDSTAALLMSVRGIVCKVHLGTQRMLQCRIEFGQSAAPLQPVAIPLVSSVLQMWGASLDDSVKWRTRADGHALIIEGELSPSGLKRLMSVVHPPIVSSAARQAGAESSNVPTAEASKKYLRSIQHELDDLRGTLKKTRDNHCLWYERSARTIDGLPMLKVDPDLLTFGARVSNSLRYQAQAERFSNVRAGTRRAENETGKFYGGVSSYDGYYYTPTAGGNEAAINAQENENAAGVKFSEWKQIEDGLVEIRRGLTQKYSVEF